MTVKYFTENYIPEINVYGSDHKIERAFLVDGAKFATPEIQSGFNKRTKRRILAGQVYPSNDASAIGIIVHDYDVTWPDATVNVAVCVHGVIMQNKLPYELNANAKAAMMKKGVMFWNGNIGNNKPVLKCWNVAEFIAGTEEHIMVSVQLEGAQFLPLIAYPGRWTITRGVIEEVSIKTWNLVFLWINVKDIKSGTGEIKVNFANKFATTAQSSSNPLPDAITVAKYYAPTAKNIELHDKILRSKKGIKLDGSKIFN